MPLIRPKSRGQKKARPKPICPRIEALEDRFLLSTTFAIDPIISTTSLSSPAPPAPTYTDFNLSQFSSEAELRQYLIDQAVLQYKYLFGTHFIPYSGPPVYPLGGVFYAGNTVSTLSAFDTGGKTSDPTTALTSPTSFSGTNNQVAGVDEADFVKTDGQYIYVFSGTLLSILKAWPAQGLSIVSQLPIEGNPVGLYLSDGRLTVVSSVYDSKNFPNSAVKISVLDVSDPTAPKIAQETYLDGYYISSRAIGDRVYVVVGNQYYFPRPEYQSDGAGFVYETEDAYRARLAAMPISSLLPNYYIPGDTPQDPPRKAGALADPLKIYKPVTTGYNELISLVVFDVTNSEPGPIDSVSVIAPNGSIVYATEENLYLVAQRWNYPSPTDSLILKFHLGDGELDLTAAGAVPGWISSPYFLNEQNGYLRVVTNHWDSSGQSSSLYVLAQQDDELQIVGSLQNLEPGESLYAAQFIGDDCFLITAHVVDPLVTLDLSNPTDPRLVGQLTIPGFLGYLQAIDSTHILGIGRQRHDLQISLFDVSNLSQPVLVDQYVIGEANDYVWSPAINDPHAFGYYPEFHTLAFAVSGSLSATSTVLGPQPQQEVSFFIVLGVDPSQGFHLVGQIDQDGYLQRSLRIENYLYSISNTSVQVQTINSPQTEIGEVYIQDVILHQAGTSIQANPGRELSGPVATFIVKDPSQVWAWINWGDGQTSYGTIVANKDGTVSVTGSHTYFKQGNYSITVNISNQWGSVQVQSTASVEPAPDQRPVTTGATGSTLTIFRGTTIFGPGVHFTTDNPKNLEAIIDWGDGTNYGYPYPLGVGAGIVNLAYGRADVSPIAYRIQAPDATIQPDGQGGFTILENHTYYTPGTYRITVTIYNDDGIPSVVQSRVVVNWLPSDTNICGPPVPYPVPPGPAPSPPAPVQQPIIAVPAPSSASSGIVNFVLPTQLSPAAAGLSQPIVLHEVVTAPAPVLGATKPTTALTTDSGLTGMGSLPAAPDPLSAPVKDFEPIMDLALISQVTEEPKIADLQPTSEADSPSTRSTFWEKVDFRVDESGLAVALESRGSNTEDGGSNIEVRNATLPILDPRSSILHSRSSIHDVDPSPYLDPSKSLILLLAGAPFVLCMTKANTQKKNLAGENENVDET